MRLLPIASLSFACGVAGPSPVGVRTETFSARDGRTVTAEIWYPAHASEGPEEIYTITDFLPESYRSEDLGTVPTTAVRDAKLDRSGGPYPLIVFSHGNAGLRIQSTYLTVALASRGYVVAAPDHAGNTLADFVSLQAYAPGLGFDLEAVLESYEARPHDLTAIIDGAPALDLAIDMDRIGALGHSFGAVTALRSLVLEARIDVAVSQAPASYELSWFDMDRELNEVGAPVMLQAGGMDRFNPDDPVVDSVWAHVSRPGRYARLHRAGHFTFSDFCVVSMKAVVLAKETGFGDVIDDGCGPANVPIDVAHALIEGMTVDFFDLHLRGEARAFEIVPAEVTIEDR